MAALAYMEWTYMYMYVMLFAMTISTMGFWCAFLGMYLHMTIFEFLMSTRRGSRSHALPAKFIACMVIGLSIPL